MNVVAKKGQAIGRCSGCGASIIWIKMAASGKGMPCDPEKISSDNLNPGDKIVLETGEILTVGNKRVEGYGLEGYVSHFATCPNANRFRKKGK